MASMEQSTNILNVEKFHYHTIEIKSVTASAQLLLKGCWTWARKTQLICSTFVPTVPLLLMHPYIMWWVHMGQMERSWRLTDSMKCDCLIVCCLLSLPTLPPYLDTLPWQIWAFEPGKWSLLETNPEQWHQPRHAPLASSPLPCRTPVSPQMPQLEAGLCHQTKERWRVGSSWG